MKGSDVKYKKYYKEGSETGQEVNRKGQRTAKQTFSNSFAFVSIKRFSTRKTTIFIIQKQFNSKILTFPLQIILLFYFQQKYCFVVSDGKDRKQRIFFKNFLLFTKIVVNHRMRSHLFHLHVYLSDK